MTDILEVIGQIVAILFAISVGIGAPICGVAYYSACRSADIYNAQHHTAYTCSDFFWAGDQINAQTQTVHIQ